MKRKTRLRLVAPLIAAALFSIAFLAVHFTLNPRERAAAVGELNALLDTAGARVEAAAEASGSFAAEADAALIHKARTVARFLAHDDTLLATDALAVLCELIDLRLITVADGAGTVIAASDASVLGRSYAEDAEMSWCLPLADEGAEPAAAQSGGERVGGAPRTDIEGFVLVWEQNALLAALSAGMDIRAAAENLAVEPDAIQLVETVGEDGVFEQDGMLYVQRAAGEVTLIASRPLERVHAVQNAVLLSLGIFAALSIAALFAWQLAGDRHLPADEAPEDADGEDDEDQAGDMPAAEAETEAERLAPRREKRPGKRRLPRLFERVEITDEEDFDEGEAEADVAAGPAEAPEPEPEPPRRARRTGPRHVGRGRPADSEDEDTRFDKIFE
ncbi:MAG: hypothetical protein Q4C13_03120 [Clostridia bacterium]|nr:hypothetical protein [Clostridia bacterium]